MTQKPRNKSFESPPTTVDLWHNKGRCVITTGWDWTHQREVLSK